MGLFLPDSVWNNVQPLIFLRILFPLEKNSALWDHLIKSGKKTERIFLPSDSVKHVLRNVIVVFPDMKQISGSPAISMIVHYT